jgi:predicted nuclease of predicted toxin-antitoxin system
MGRGAEGSGRGALSAMKLLFDENLSRKLVPLLHDLFPGSAHVTLVGLGPSARDRDIWNYAQENNFAIVTADSDFLFLANTLGPPPKVILLENCDYPTDVAVRILRREANRILDFEGSTRALLTLKA